MTVTKDATASAIKTMIDDQSNYDVPQLRVGVYSIAVAARFLQAVSEHITVSVGNRQHIDLALSAGEAWRRWR